VLDTKKPPALCHQSGGFKSTELFCSRPCSGLAHRPTTTGCWSRHLSFS